MADPLLIFAGAQHEAYAFAQSNGITGYSVITEDYHLRNYERGSTIVMVGSWAQNPRFRRVEDEARKRGCPIQTENAWLQNRRKA